MKQNLAPIRPAMTAIAAAIALSSTPLLAQVAEPTDAQSAPVVAAPPPAAEPAAPAAAPDIAPAVQAPAVQAPAVQAPAVQATAPQPAMKTMSTPVEHTADTTAPSATTGAGEAAPVRHETAASVAASHHAASPSRATVAPATAPAHSASIADTPVVKTAAPTSAPAVAAPAPAPAAPAPAATVRNTTVQSSSTDATLPIAGAVGLGLLAAGGVYAMRRRRRDDDELVLDTPLESAPVVTAEPIVVAPRTAAPATATAATLGAAEGPDRLPNGFDLSRFGRHTRAAYRGPTPDNPSYSLRRRLKHASFFDQREREAAAAGAPLKEPVYARSEAPQAAPADNGQVTVRLSPERQRSRLGYILQR